MNKERLKFNFSIAFDAVKVNKIRSLLTALGIIFGVAAVISMLSIGRGAQVELLEQIKLVGVNNIVVTPIVEQEEEEVSKNENTRKEILNMSNGLSLHDSESILGVIPGIDRVSPEVVLDTYIIKSGLRRSAKLVGIEPDYFDIADFELVQGLMFSDEQLEKGLPVCIIGSGIKAKFFSKENAIGKMLKCGNNWLRVIGVLENKSITKTSIENLGIRNYNMDVYTPIKTVLMRYTNRSLITERLIKLAANPDENRELLNRKNYHQIDRLVVQVSQSDKISNIADIISRMLKRRHNGIVDYQIEIPELLLKTVKHTSTQAMVTSLKNNQQLNNPTKPKR
jgi:putative ABC transport system permease protein